MNIRCICTVFLLAAFLADGQTTAPSARPTNWQGTWAATAGNGGPGFAGTWGAVGGETPNTVAGAWSLRDQNGTELATGTWAAAKEGKIWKGTWQARRASGQVYNGTWNSQTNARIELPATAHFSELFEAAIVKAVSGSWALGNSSGAWTIRAYAPQ